VVESKLVLVGESSYGGSGSKTSITKTSMGKSSMANSSKAKTGMGYSCSIADMGNSGGNSVGSITNMLNRLGNTDSFIGNSVDWSVDRCDDSLGRVGLVSSMVDMRGLYNLLDGVDLVGSGNWDGTWDGNVIRSSDMLVDSDDTLNRGWDMDRDINIVLLYIDLRDDVGSLRSDPGVSPDRGEYLCLDNSVSRSKTSRDRCWRDGSIRCWWSRDHWSGQSNSLNMVLGNTSSIRDSWLSNVLNTTNRVSMTTDNRLDSSLDNLMSNNSILNTALNLGGSSSIGLVGYSNNSGSRDHWGSSY